MFSSRLFPSVFNSSLYRDPFLTSSSSLLNRPSIFEEDPFFNPNLSIRQQQQQQYPDVDMEERKEPLRQQQQSGVNRENVAAQTESNIQQPATQQQQQMQSYQPSSRYLSPWGMERDWLGGGFMDPLREMNTMMRRMDQLANRMWREETMEPLPEVSLPQGVDSSTYSVSSSSFSQTGADGKQISHSTRSERRRIGDVLEESVQYTDSDGNTRISSKRGLGPGQLQEVTIDRNAKGEQRKVENLRGIKPEEVEQFQSKWKEAAQKYDPERRLLGKSDELLLQQQQQPAITSGVGEKQQQKDQPEVKVPLSTTPEKKPMQTTGKTTIEKTSDVDSSKRKQPKGTEPRTSTI